MIINNNKIKSLKPKLNSRYKQGYISVDECKKLFESQKNQPIIYRSSYERDFIRFLESNPNIVGWGSECIEIRYYNPIDKSFHSYYPDFVVRYVDNSIHVIEIKPSNQLKKPDNHNRYQVNEYIKNTAKWKAAKTLCDRRGYRFSVISEKSLKML